jgi:hypothetical protein
MGEDSQEVGTDVISEEDGDEVKDCCFLRYRVSGTVDVVDLSLKVMFSL